MTRNNLQGANWFDQGQSDDINNGFLHDKARTQISAGVARLNIVRKLIADETKSYCQKAKIEQQLSWPNKSEKYSKTTLLQAHDLVDKVDQCTIQLRNIWKEVFVTAGFGHAIDAKWCLGYKCRYTPATLLAECAWSIICGAPTVAQYCKGNKKTFGVCRPIKMGNGLTLYGASFSTKQQPCRSQLLKLL